MPDEWALVYTYCQDYSNIDADPSNIFVLDEKTDNLSKRVSDLSINKKNAFKKAVENKVGKDKKTELETVDSWITELGKQINPRYEAKGLYVR